MRGIPLERFTFINDWLCFVSGYLFNTFLLWLLAKRTTKELRPYRPILLLSTLTNLAYLGVFGVVVPVMFTNGVFFTAFVLGPIGWVSPTSEGYHFLLFEFVTFFYFFSIYSLCVPFAYRYAIICAGRQNYGAKAFLLMLVGPTAVALGMCVLQFVVAYPPRVGIEARNAVLEQLFGGEGGSNKDQGSGCNNATMLLDTVGSSPPMPNFTFAFLAPDTTSSMPIAAYVVPMTTITYSLVFYFGWRIYAHLKRLQLKHLDEQRARELNLQVSTALLLQACVPLVLEFTPTMVLCVPTLFGWPNSSHYSGYMPAIVAWIAVIDPLITMWVIRKYRAVAFGWLGRLGRFAAGVGTSQALAAAAVLTPPAVATGI